MTKSRLPSGRRQPHARPVDSPRVPARGLPARIAAVVEVQHVAVDPRHQLAGLAVGRRAVSVAHDRLGTGVPRRDHEVCPAEEAVEVGGAQVAGDEDVDGRVVEVFGAEPLEATLVDELVVHAAG